MGSSASHYTRLPDDLVDWVKQYHQVDARRKYHNWFHVNRLYTWADNWKMPYDLSFDLSIAFHDAVYDAKPDKEVRSRDMMLEVVPRFMSVSTDVLETAASLIDTTIDHTPCSDNRLLLCDLADFSVEFFRKVNAMNVFAESTALYTGLNKATYLKNSIHFLRGLRNRLEDNDRYWGVDTEKFSSIILGISAGLCDAQLEYANTCK